MGHRGHRPDRRPIDDTTLREWVTGAAANFLIQTSERTASYRLFHQALNDTLVADRPVVEDQQALTRAFTRYGAGLGWANAPPYLWRSLAHHALAGHDIDIDPGATRSTCSTPT